MTEQNPVTRGRRNPELALELNTRSMMATENEQDVDEDFTLLAGDTILGKTSIQYHTTLGEAWSTFGVQTRILDGESVEEAYGRLVAATNEGVIAIADDAVDQVNAMVEERRAAQAASPRGRIVPRHTR